MKRILGILAILFLLFSCYYTHAQKNDAVITDSFEVSGTCTMCKERIEDAAYIPGVKRAEWNKETHSLKVSYRTSKTTLSDIKHSIAKAGHDAGEVKATDNDYKKLPECCAYRENATCDH